jgi:hypothetical protein
MYLYLYYKYRVGVSCSRIFSLILSPNNYLLVKSYWLDCKIWMNTWASNLHDQKHISKWLQDLFVTYVVKTVKIRGVNCSGMMFRYYKAGTIGTNDNISYINIWQTHFPACFGGEIKWGKEIPEQLTLTLWFKV